MDILIATLMLVVANTTAPVPHGSTGHKTRYVPPMTNSRRTN